MNNNIEYLTREITDKNLWVEAINPKQIVITKKLFPMDINIHINDKSVDMSGFILVQPEKKSVFNMLQIMKYIFSSNMNCENVAFVITSYTKKYDGAYKIKVVYKNCNKLWDILNDIETFMKSVKTWEDDIKKVMFCEKLSVETVHELHNKNI